jgi:hypothetical protein
MVEEFKKILSIIKKDKRPVALFAVLKMDELTDRWSVIFSAEGLEDESERKKMFDYLVGLIKKHVNSDQFHYIARVGIFPLQNHLVVDLLKYSSGASINGSVQINGNIVHEGYILESVNKRE